MQHPSTDIFTIPSFLLSKWEGERTRHCIACILNSLINRIKCWGGALLFWQFFNCFLKPAPIYETKDCGKSSHNRLFGKKKPNLTLFIVLPGASGVFIRERKLWKPCSHLHKKWWWSPLKMGGALLHNISFPFFFHCFFPLLSFFSLSPTWPLRLTTTCITQHYNSSTIRWAERKATHTCLFSCFLLLSYVFPILSFFLWPNHKRKWPKTVKCLETQYGLHPGDYTVISAKVPWNNNVANPRCRLACVFVWSFDCLNSIRRFFIPFHDHEELMCGVWSYIFMRISLSHGLFSLSTRPVHNSNL